MRHLRRISVGLLLVVASCGKATSSETDSESSGSGGELASGGSGGGEGGSGGDRAVIVPQSGGAPPDDGSCQGEGTFDCQEAGLVTIVLGTRDPVRLNHPAETHECEGVVRLEALTCPDRLVFSLDAHVDAVALGGAGGEGSSASVSLELHADRSAPARGWQSGDLTGEFRDAAGVLWSFSASPVTLMSVDGLLTLEFQAEATDPVENTLAISVSAFACLGEQEYCI